MLPTPSTSHVPYSRVYEPAEDSYLLLDILSSPTETAFLAARFPPATSPPPLVVEVGTGSGVVVGFAHAQAASVFGRRDVLTAGTDVNVFACRATNTTAQGAGDENPLTRGVYLDCVAGDLIGCWRGGSVDVLVFNPPYVPTEELPSRPTTDMISKDSASASATTTATKTIPSTDVPSRTSFLPNQTSFEEDSYLLSLSYAGGKDGIETTDRLLAALPSVLSARGCAYVLLCAQNRPNEVAERILGFGPDWRVVTAGESGKTAGWEKLSVIRIWREGSARVS